MEMPLFVKTNKVDIHCVVQCKLALLAKGLSIEFPLHYILLLV